MLRYANIATLRRQWLLILICAVIGAVGAFGYSSTLTPMYRSAASLYFTLNFGNSASDLAQGSTYTSNQMISFGMLATSAVVLDEVINDLGLELTNKELAGAVSVSTPRNTVVMEISVESPDPQRAARIANSIADHTKVTVEAYAPQREDGSSTVNVRTIQNAVPAEFQFAPNKRLNAAIGLLVGLLGGGLLAFAQTALDNRIRNESSLQVAAGVTFLGSLRQRGRATGKEAVVLQEPTSQAAEDYRKLRTSLRFATLSKHPLTLVVSSSVPAEGKTTVSVNLAAVLAESGQRVLLIDADLRRPRVASYVHVDGALGLTDVLVNEASITDAVVPLGSSGVDVLAAGSWAPNPGELLSSPQMAAVIQESLTQYSVVILDSAPVLAVPDALALTQMSDGMVVVSMAGTTRKKDIQRALTSIQSAGGVVFGAVLNGVKVPRNRNLGAYTNATQQAPMDERRGSMADEGAGPLGSDLSEEDSVRAVSESVGPDLDEEDSVGAVAVTAESGTGS